MKKNLTMELIIKEAQNFAKRESTINHIDLLGITDGKAVGTYVEHRFKTHLSSLYHVNIGNSARGIDLPDENINTDIKVTSYKQPQSSCPFKSPNQKIFGLGYNLLVFIYKKEDIRDFCKLDFINCTFISKERTADYTTTKRIIEMLKDDANKDDLVGYFVDKNIPGDEIVYDQLADTLLQRKPVQGYLTISNALQWRLQYARVMALNNTIDGVINYDCQE